MLFASLSALRVGFHHAIAPVSHWEEHLSMARPIKCPPVASNPALIPKRDLLKAAEWKHNKRNDARPSFPSNLQRLHFLLHCSLAHHSSCPPDLDPILPILFTSVSLSLSLSVPSASFTPSVFTSTTLKRNNSSINSHSVYIYSHDVPNLCLLDYFYSDKEQNRTEQNRIE